MYELPVRLGKGKPVVTKTGPNDKSGVILGHTYVFLYFLHAFYILTNGFYLIRSYLSWMYEEGWGGQPKRALTTRLALLGAFFFPSLFLTLINVFTLYLGSTGKI